MDSANYNSMSRATIKSTPLRSLRHCPNGLSQVDELGWKPELAGLQALFAEGQAIAAIMPPAWGCRRTHAAAYASRIFRNL